MCSGGNDVATQTAQTQQTQSYKPRGLPLMVDVAKRANSAAQLPYAPYTGQMVAGFTPEQQEAMDNVSVAYQNSQPYMQESHDLFAKAAQPLQQSDIDNYFNPYSSAVMQNLQEVFGQQNRDETGRLQGLAGGVGANRIAVGKAEMARQQGLAAGQTMAGIYQNALQAAQNQQGIEQASAYGLGQLGPAQLNAALAAYGAQFGMGTALQQTNQAGLNANYNEFMRKEAFPYQQAQWYAGIGLPAASQMGGTSKGSGTQTGTYNPADPSTFSQVAGAVTAGAGAVGSFYGAKRGGAIKGYAEGGSPMGGMGDSLYGGVQGYIPGNAALEMGAQPQFSQMEFLNPAQYSGTGGKGSNVQPDYGSMGTALGGAAGNWSNYNNAVNGWDTTVTEGAKTGGRILEDSEPYKLLTKYAGGAAVEKDGGGGAVASGILSGLGMVPIWDAVQNPSPFSMLGMMQGAGQEEGSKDQGWSDLLGMVSPAYGTIEGFAEGGVPGMNFGAPDWMGDQDPALPFMAYADDPTGNPPKLDYRLSPDKGKAPFLTTKLNGGLDPLPGGSSVPVDKGAGWSAHARSDSTRPGELSVAKTSPSTMSPFQGMVSDPEPINGFSMAPAPDVARTDSPWTPMEGMRDPNQPMALGPMPMDPPPTNVNPLVANDKNPGPYVPGVSGKGGAGDDYYASTATPDQTGYGHEGGPAPTSSPEMMAQADSNLPELPNAGPRAPIPPAAAGPEGPGIGSPQRAAPWADFVAKYWQKDPKDNGYLQRLARNPLFLMGMGMMGGTSPYAGANIGQGALKGLEAVRGFQQMDLDRQAKMMQQVLDGAGQDTREAQLASQDQNRILDNARGFYERGFITGNQKYFQMGDALMEEAGMGGDKNIFRQAYDRNTLAAPPRVEYPEGADPKYAINVDAVPENVDAFSNQYVSDMGQKGAQAKSDRILKESEEAASAAKEIQKETYEANRYLDSLPKEGLGAAGSFFNERTGLLRFGNTLQRITGMTMDDTAAQLQNDVGTMEALQKLQTRAGFDLARTLGTREAMQVIQQALAAVAGGQMSPQGAKNIIYNVVTGAQMNRDKYKFVDAWARKSWFGSAVGADTYFGEYVGPLEKYIERVETLKKLDAARLAAGSDTASLKALQDQALKEYMIEPWMYGAR